ncbi:hypothetical protein ACIQTZ_00495 [Paenarthrobacter sp. NPDC090520]|uniref:hypothetical protein n=1 Tax=Paenarthrobacter sp. NPDC090520 TaxID=3364382 RepID=UPI00380AD73D
MSGYRTVHAVEAVVKDPMHLRPGGIDEQRHRVEVIAWEDEPTLLVTISSGFTLDEIRFQVEDLDLFIELLQQTKALLEAAPTESGAAASSPAAAAPVHEESIEQE